MYGAMLFRRGAVWYYRKEVPKQVQSILGRTTFTVSLQTTDMETAKARLPAEALKAVRAIEAAKLTLQRGPDAVVEQRQQGARPAGLEAGSSSQPAEGLLCPTIQHSHQPNESSRRFGRHACESKKRAAFLLMPATTSALCKLRAGGRERVSRFCSRRCGLRLPLCENLTCR
jgi:hypothetical protein